MKSEFCSGPSNKLGIGFVIARYVPYVRRVPPETLRTCLEKELTLALAPGEPVAG
jgi:hypothetical protein